MLVVIHELRRIFIQLMHIKNQFFLLLFLHKHRISALPNRVSKSSFDLNIARRKCRRILHIIFHLCNIRLHLSVGFLDFRHRRMEHLSLASGIRKELIINLYRSF